MKAFKVFKFKGYIWATVFSIALLLILLISSIGFAQDNPLFIGIIQTIEPEKSGLSHPSGIAFSSRANAFYVAETLTDQTNTSSISTIRHVSVLGQEVGSTQINLAIENPINLTMDNRTGRLLIYQASTRQLVELRENSAGRLDPNTLGFHKVSFGLINPQGMTFDPIHSYLYFLDADGSKLIRVLLPLDGSFTDLKYDSTSLQWAAGIELHGIAYDITSGNLFVSSPSEQTLYEVNTRGELVATRDLYSFNLSNPSGMVFAPSGDQTDNTSLSSLYLADNGIPPVTPVSQFASENNYMQLSEGMILEFSLIQPEHYNFITAFQSTLVKTTNTSAYSPPSPDSSGLTYISSRNTLMMSDCEVEEIVSGVTHFMGANVWEVNLDGSVVRTANISSVAPTSVPMTDEPTGMSWNPANGHYYISDDDAVRVYDLNPGSDGLIGTADDSWTSFSTNSAGNGDPEGIAYDSWHDQLFVVDGVNQEVYQYSLSGTPLGHFDVQVYGVSDPEGIDFNAISGTLFILSSSSNRVIVETTTAGSMIQSINVSASASVAQAGLAYAPASDGSGLKHFYIVDRGIDNNEDRNIIDGKMYEMTAPVPGSPGNIPPVVNAGPDQTVTIANGVTLIGSASDDGLPNPPNTITTQWSMVSGTGNVTFTNPYALSTTASFSAAGSYILRLAASDSELISYDELNVSVTGVGGAIVVEVRVATGSDDAEESASGSVNLTSSDLELVYDGGNQTVGMRFNGLTIPKNSQITNAYIQFQVDEVNSESTSLTLWGEAQDNPGTFTTGTRNISSRVKTATYGGWTPPPWTVEGQAGADQRTPNLSAILQEIVNRTGWTTGNSIVVIIGGTGHRTAVAYEGSSPAAPLLYVEYIPPAQNTPTSTASQTPTLTPSPTKTSTSTPTRTATLTPSPTSTSTSTPSQTPTLTPSPTNTSTSTPTRTATLTPSPTSTSTSTPSQTPTLTPLPINTSTSTPTRTATLTSSPTSISTSTPTNTASSTPFPTYTATSTPTQTASSTPSPTNISTHTSTPVNTATITPTPSYTATSTASRTPTNTPTDTTTPTITYTPLTTNTPTATSTYTPSPTKTSTGTPSQTASITPTHTDTATVTLTQTTSSTPTQTNTSSPTPTPSATPSPTVTRTPTQINTPTPTPTRTATSTPTATATFTPTPSPTPAGPITLNARVSASSDDAEESSTGYMYLTSTDLELVYDGNNQTVGMRFNGLTIPKGAQINAAYIQFQVDEVNSEATSLTLWGEAQDNPGTFVSSSGNISSRLKTTATVGWSPVAWTVVGQSGLDQRTPNISAIIQEIVNRPGWTAGNSLVIIITGTGHRTAVAYNGIPAGAPLLHVEWSTTPQNHAPSVTINSPRTNTTFIEGNQINFNGIASDFEDGDITTRLIWTSNLDGTIGTGGNFSTSNLSRGVHTITARATDNDGLAGETTLTLTVFENAPVLVGAGDIAMCDNDARIYTSQLLSTIAGSVITLGDNAQLVGAESEFTNCYDPTWGLHKARTHPVPGNHDYNTSEAAPYYNYFGAAAGEPGKGYYSYDLGSWHIIALNSEIDVSAGSTEEQWLRADLSAHSNTCTLAYWHQPRFSSGTIHGSNENMGALWQALYDYGADVVLNGHEHMYERFTAQNPAGVAEPTRGIREFIVGTGGAYLGYPIGTTLPNSEVVNNNTYGVIKLTLNATSYNWEFIPIPGMTFTDSGSAPCVGVQPANTQTPTSTATATQTMTSTSTITPSPTNTVTPTPTQTGSSTPFPTYTATSTPTQTASSTPFPTYTATSTPTQTASLTPSPTNPSTSTPTQTASSTPFSTYTATSTPTQTASSTPSPTNISTHTSTPVNTATITPTPSYTATSTASRTPTNTPTDTTTPTITYTPLLTNTPTATSTYTPSPTKTSTRTPSQTASITPTHTDTATVTLTQTTSSTPTQTNTSSPTPTPSATPSPTVTRTPTQINTPTPTPTRTATSTPTATATFTPTPSPTPIGLMTLNVRVTASSDDAEESASGNINLTHSYLELVYDKSNQIIGIRFNNLTLPQSATIHYAYVQFQTGKVSSQVTSLSIKGQATDNAPTFRNLKKNISSRVQTTASANWTPSSWTVINESGAQQRTPNLSALIQEVINRPGWTSGNSVVLIITGSGVRTAWSYNGLPSGAPLLHIEYTVP